MKKKKEFNGIERFKFKLGGRTVSVAINHNFLFPPRKAVCAYFVKLGYLMFEIVFSKKKWNKLTLYQKIVCIKHEIQNKPEPNPSLKPIKKTVYGAEITNVLGKTNDNTNNK